MSKVSIDYKKLNAELELILESLQSGELAIDQAIISYERGQKIISQLQDYLKTAENQVKKVSKG